MSSPLLRPWTDADIPAVARIFAAGWRQAYSGFMPAAVLTPRIDPAYREGELREWLASDFDAEQETVIVAEADGAVTGFVAMRIGDKEGLGTAGFVPLLYVDPAAQRRRLGARLLLAGLDWLEARRPGALAISAFAQNPFRGYYDAIGGRVAKVVTAQVDGHPLEVAQYYWPSLDAVRAGIRARG